VSGQGSELQPEGVEQHSPSPCVSAPLLLPLAPCRASLSAALLFASYGLQQRCRPFLVSSTLSDGLTASALEQRLQVGGPSRPGNSNHTKQSSPAASVSSAATRKRFRAGAASTVPLYQVRAMAHGDYAGVARVVRA
jgi:hypothetical protein